MFAYTIRVPHQLPLRARSDSDLQTTFPLHASSTLHIDYSSWCFLETAILLFLIMGYPDYVS